ncbi:MAG: inositol monophosphatase family protein [Candidatus Nanopelagicales bacterium]
MTPSDLELALQLADRGDEIALGRFRARDLHVETKLDRTPVTEADQAVERALRAELAEHRPTDLVLGEEYGGELPPSGRVWVIDPIDSTMNYLRGVPVWATLIALLEDGSPQIGVVSAPALGTRWWAELPGPARCRDRFGERELHVSGIAALAEASISLSDPVGWPSGAFDRCAVATGRLRAYGDFWSYMLVAEGSVDIAAEPQLSVWDLAAILPIVTAAGGRVSSRSGGDPVRDSNLVASNGLLHAQALQLLG